MRLDEVVFLDVDDVLEAHAIGIERFGGSPGLRDAGLLDSAVMAARSGYYATLGTIAAVYAYGIAMNHPFVDGNKRAALSAAGMFLNVHGFDLQLGMDWVEHMENVASGKLSRDELVELFVQAMETDIPIAEAPLTPNNQTPPELLRNWMGEHRDLGLRAVMMMAKMLPGIDAAALEDDDPLKRAGVVVAMASIFDLAILSGAPDLYPFVEPPPDVPKITDRIWRRSVESWGELRSGPLSSSAIFEWFRAAVAAGHK